MRIIRVKYRGLPFYASLEEGGNYVRCLQTNLGHSDLISISDVIMLPLVAPSKIICMGLNFSDHAREMSMSPNAEPAFFLKPPSSLLASGQTILVPPGVGRVDYEAELAVVIGQFCRNVSVAQAPDFVFGYTCANDVTARDLQKNERMFGRCKGYDTFCPLGPWLETVLPEPDAGIRALVNGTVRQEGFIRDMVVQPLELVSYVSGIMSLVPGDVILCGTPQGVGSIKPGDQVGIEVDQVGILFNDVALDSNETGSRRAESAFLQ